MSYIEFQLNPITIVKKQLPLILFLISYSSFCFGFSSLPKDSILQLINSATTTINKVELLIDISVIHSDQLQLDSSCLYANRALTLAKDDQIFREIGQSYYALGYAFDMVGKLDKAFENYELARQAYEKNGDPLDVAKAMNAKGAAAYFGGDLDLAIKYYLEALSYDKTHNLLEEQGDVLNNIALIYEDTDKDIEAMEMFKKSLAINKAVKDTAGMAHAYHGIGTSYLKLADFQNSISYLDSSIHINQILKDTVLLARSYSQKGNAFRILKNDYKKAKDNLLLADKYFRTHPDQTMLFNNLIFLGKNELSANNTKGALKYFELAKDYIINTERKQKKQEIFQLLKETYSSVGNYEKAFEAFVNYDKLYKETQNTERQKYVEEIQTKYETDQKEKQIQIQRLKLSQASNQKNLFVVLALLFAIALLGAIAFIKQKIKSNEKLAAQKLIVEKSLKEKDILLREIHHRVKNNLQVISSLLSLQSRYSDDPNIESALQEGKNRVKSMSLIHQNLYQKENLTGIDIQDYFTKLFKSLFSSYNIHPDKIKLELDIDKLNLDVETVVPIGLIVNEMVSNSLKYAFPDNQAGVIKVSIQENDHHISLQVSDNGIGISDLDKINSGDSFGYTLIESFKKKLNAEIEVKSENGTNISMIIKNFKKVA